MEELANYCAGEAAEAEASKILSHLAQCPRCAEIAGMVLDEEPARTIPVLPDRQIGRTALGGVLPRRRLSLAPSRHRAWYAAAAAVVLTAGITVAWLLRQAGRPETLLAAAYTEARPFDYWLPDQGYSPVRVQRGSASVFDRPQALISAESVIRRLLANHPEDARTLALEGRAELLEQDYEHAVENLTRAAELTPGRAEILVDLGCALALRGDAEKRAIDYGHALEVFSRALKLDPRDARALFNSAIVYERLWLVDDALQAWHKLLELKPSAGWTAEAHRHIDDLQKLRQEKKKAENRVIQDPAAFLAAATPDLDPEPYLDVFWREWLPRAGTDAKARAAATIVARQFAGRFGDTSLLDTVSATSTTAQAEAAAALGKVLAMSQSGGSDAALAGAGDVITRLKAAKLPAAAMRVQLELAYSYNRAARRQECLGTSGEVLPAARQRGYVWLEQLAHLIHASCAEALGRSGPARVEFEGAYKALERRGFQVQSLLALGLLAAIDGASGNYPPVWDNDREGLRRYWTTNASPMRAQQFQYDLQKSAAALGWNGCAVILLQAATRSAHDANSSSIEMVDRVETAVLLAKIGDFAGEEAELNRAAKSAQSMPPGATRDDLEWNVELDRAEAEIASGRIRGALQRLVRLEKGAGARRIREQMRLNEMRGRALLAQKDSKGAAEAFAQAIACNRQRIASNGGYTDRLAELEMAGPSYRALTELLLGEQSGARASLRLWHEYQDRPERSGALATATITYAVLPGTIAVWLTDASGTRIRRVDAAGGKVELAARQFVRLCATPESSEMEIRSIGHELFGWLIAPELKQERGTAITLETDEWISSIPFGALTDDTGSYLAESQVISEAPDSDLDITRNSTALVVAAPEAIAPGRGRLPVLRSAAAEAENVASRFTRAVVLREGTAAEDALASLAPKTELFHFSGHGWSDGGNGALLLPSPGAEDSRFITARSLAHQDWSRCSLAVLSACLTGSGEQQGPVNSQSLVRALLSAGTRRVIASRWSVDSDATSDLMRRFYDGIFAGRKGAQALANAEAGVAACRPWSHPYYWAGFEIFGRS